MPENPRLDSNQRACDHCGALVFSDTKKCVQCGHFPVKLHRCPQCKTIGSAGDERCSKCERMYEPGGDFL